MKLVKQDITKIDRGIIAHGCNAQGVMGSGAALALRNRWPEIFAPYRQLCVQHKFGDELLGKCCVAKVHEFPQLYVANCITQHLYGTDGQPYAKVEAIDESLRLAFEFARATDLPLYAVKIGCLRGGLSWQQDVKPLFETISAEYSGVEFYVCDL